MSNHHDTTHIDWDEMGPLLERGAELQSPLYRQAAAWLGELLPAAGIRRILDIGSGPGVLTSLLAEAFPHAEVVAVDATPPLLERARIRAERAGFGDRVRTQYAELPSNLDELGEADLVWAGNSVHHIGDQRAALSDLARLLRPGGVLAVVEGGLPTRHLPRDIGIGRPGLEGRLDAAAGEWFIQMRAELPGTKDEVEDWRALLAAGGLTPSGTRSFLLDIPAPVPEAVGEQLVSAFAWQRKILDGRLPADDLAVLDRLLDPDDPQGLRHRADAYLLTARTVHTARRG
ncbi:class I SAM-dependent methyltransferase [Streptomyces lunaelactis]|uniref:class I SAM-dependent methyltransferase n=1 Tax=Streptomyces lunaelactis TaxID=1535768 RepID=UPI0015853FFA|nr:class I SAM-dependent methyltransferase [Streptomyces lunaelactis]NUK74864.1 class I SAM-dependent methyltransferase [Streptomyces lunaelactis]NUK81256.1 class I SAM-dependent methyltransferase [Streptomyces lunaelactis]